MLGGWSLYVESERCYRASLEQRLAATNAELTRRLEEYMKIARDAGNGTAVAEKNTTNRFELMQELDRRGRELEMLQLSEHHLSVELKR